MKPKTKRNAWSRSWLFTIGIPVLMLLVAFITWRENNRVADVAERSLKIAEEETAFVREISWSKEKGFFTLKPTLSIVSIRWFVHDGLLPTERYFSGPVYASISPTFSADELGRRIQEDYDKRWAIPPGQKTLAMAPVVFEFTVAVNGMPQRRVFQAYTAKVIWLTPENNPRAVISLPDLPARNPAAAAVSPAKSGYSGPDLDLIPGPTLRSPKEARSFLLTQGTFVSPYTDKTHLRSVGRSK